MFGSLRLRLGLLISLAVLPLGLVAVHQSVRMITDARDLEEQDILFRTTQAAAAQQELFREAFGAAEAIGISAVAIGPETPACDRLMAELVERSANYVFAGFLDAEGQLVCSFNGERADFSEDPEWKTFVADPRERLTVNRNGAVSGQSVVITMVPVFNYATKDLLGAVAISVPHTVADWLLAAQVEGLSIALVNREGDVLSASEGIAASPLFDAFRVVPGELEMTRSGVTEIITGPQGRDHLVTVVPVFDRDVFVVGIWDNGAASYAGPNMGWLTSAFPILMWITALGVAMFALERLVLRHLRKLRKQIRAFSPEDPKDVLVELDDPPVEIAEIAQSYNRMVARILSDRDVLSANVEEKELLLREVHHRVKNNLQLITSILNMQIRGLSSPREQSLLWRVQARVMSLSVVHRALYEGSHVGPIRADRLLRTVLDATFRSSLPGDGRIQTAITADEIVLDADQAVPLVLLAAEAAANAIKFLGQPEEGSPRISVSLTSSKGGEVTLAIANSTGPRLIDPVEPEVGGLGSRLIEGFAAQLDAEVNILDAEGLYSVTVAFRPLTFAAEPARQDSLSFYGAAAPSRAAGE